MDVRRIPAPFRGRARFALFWLSAALLAPWLLWRQRPALAVLMQIPLTPWITFWARLWGLRSALYMVGILEDEWGFSGYPRGLVRLAVAADRYCARGSAVVLAVTPGIARYVEDSFGVAQERVRVLPCAADPRAFRRRDRAAAAAALGIPAASGPTVGFIGGPHAWHGVGRLLSVAAGAAPRHGGLRVLVAGPGHEGRHGEQARRLGLGPRALFVGPVAPERAPEFMSLLDLAWCVIEPVRRDLGSPLKLYEYMACEVPVLVNPDGFGAWAVAAGAAAAVPVGDDPRAAEVMARLLDDPRGLAAMGRRGREAVLKGESWAHRAEALERLAGIERPG